MKFCSTRGGVRGASFEDAISQGYAPDGGLYVPESMPKLSALDLERWRGLSFPALAEALLGIFVGDELGLPAALSALVRGCYSSFDCTEIVPVKRVGGLLVVELFHGPTFCFKDLGQQPLVRLLAAFAERRKTRHTVLVSTTGDTGPAAMRAVSDSGSPNLDIVVFFPEGQISELQRRQMTTVSSSRAHVVTFEGGGDDMDAPIKNMAADRAFAKRHGMCGINSYNLGRPVSQMVHYFWSYFRALDHQGLQVGDPVDIVVPSGALGNLVAGYMSKQMGLPIRRLVAATNTNDITHRTFNAGNFHRSERMEKTLSDAINIQVPYNMERIFYYLMGEDAPTIASWMAEMDRTGQFTLPPAELLRLQEEFGSRRVDDVAMCAALRKAFETHGYLADPHTAVAMAGAWDIYGEEPPAAAGRVPPVVVLATASPCKFQASVTQAIGASGWAAYAAGAAFPEAARALLQAPERPLARLAARGSLVESQASWEREVRGWLDNTDPKARL
mmetsp:Transcript_100921/g.323921  ORF Transcript_100921/g.323921 Transcript_100921/m.323921 type:complete len:502 (+) Transcript_100921:66-1571(+)